MTRCAERIERNGGDSMPTSSILRNVVIDSREEAEKALKARREAMKIGD